MEESICLHGYKFTKMNCSNKHKCKLGYCSNKYPCRNPYLGTGRKCCSVPITKYVVEHNDECLQSSYESSSVETDGEYISARNSGYDYILNEDVIEYQDEDILSEAIKRDNVYRHFLINNIWHTDEEFKICRSLLIEQPEWLETYPYVFAYEWNVSEEGYTQEGKGDLVFFDGNFTFLVVEVKYLTTETGRTARTRNRKARHKVEEQALRYADIWCSRYPNYNVCARVYTNYGNSKIAEEIFW